MGDLKLTYQVDGGDLLQAGEASSQMKMALKKLDLPPEVIRKASICMYEGEINMVIHANGGEASVTVTEEAVEIVLIDHGPGIKDLSLAMQEGFSTAPDNVRSLGFGAGMGLPNMKRYTDEMTVDSTVGVGTTVRMKVKL